MRLDRKLYNKISHEGLFYIVCVNQEDDFWNLCLRENHFVISAVTGKDNIIRCLKNIVKGYTPLELYRQLRKCEHIVSEEYLKKKEVEYLERGVLNDDLVSSIIENTKVKKNSKDKNKKGSCVTYKGKRNRNPRSYER